MLTYWNSHRIAAEFRRRQIWPLSHAQMDRLFARLGTHRSSARRVPGPRYERERANDLWHIDLKVPFYLRSTGRPRSCHFVALVDDFSRFLLGIRPLSTKWQLRGRPVLRRDRKSTRLNSIHSCTSYAVFCL